MNSNHFSCRDLESSNWFPTIKTWKFEMPSVIRTWIFLRKKKLYFPENYVRLLYHMKTIKNHSLVGGFNHPSKKYAHQTGSFPPNMKIKHLWNHHPVLLVFQASNCFAYRAQCGVPLRRPRQRGDLHLKTCARSVEPHLRHGARSTQIQHHPA